MSIAVTENQKQIAVEMRGITKAFGTKVVANKNVDLTVYRGRSWPYSVRTVAERLP